MNNNNKPSLSYKKVPATNGLLWLKQAISLFKINPVLWLLTTTILIFILLLMAFFPLSMILAPTFFAGVMVICHVLKTDKTFKLDLLFVGFKAQFNHLLIAGIIYIAAILLSGLIVAVIAQLLGFADLSSLSPVMAEFYAGKKTQTDVLIALEPLLPSLLPTLIIMILLMLLITSAYWFVPALIMLRSCSPVEAIKQSFIASLVNFIPFLVYSLCIFIGMNFLNFILSLVFIFIPIIALPLLLISYLSIFSLYFASIYTSFDNIFPQDDNSLKSDSSYKTESSDTLVV